MRRYKDKKYVKIICMDLCMLNASIELLNGLNIFISLRNGGIFINGTISIYLYLRSSSKQEKRGCTTIFKIQYFEVARK